MVEGGRLTARKARIADVLAGNLDAVAPRVNVMGVVVSVTPGEPPSFVLDDRSALIVVRQFDKQPTPKLGAVAMVIGRVREYGGDRYITSEIAKTVDNSWLEVRSRELMNESSFVTPTLTPKTEISGNFEEEVVDDDTDSGVELISVIRQLDTGEGVSYDEILSKNPDAEPSLKLLLQRGDIFEMSPGRIKILE
jgi:hypothetical protein